MWDKLWQGAFTLIDNLSLACHSNVRLLSIEAQHTIHHSNWLIPKHRRSLTPSYLHQLRRPLGRALGHPWGWALGQGIRRSNLYGRRGSRWLCWCGRLGYTEDLGAGGGLYRDLFALELGWYWYVQSHRPTALLMRRKYIACQIFV